MCVTDYIISFVKNICKSYNTSIAIKEEFYNET